MSRIYKFEATRKIKFKAFELYKIELLIALQIEFCRPSNNSMESSELKAFLI